MILLLAIVAGAVFGVVVGAVAARLRGPYLAGATLALAVGLPQIPKTYRYFGRDQGLTINPPLPPGWLGAELSARAVGRRLSLLGAVITLLVLWNLIRSRFGRNFRAVRDDEIAAALAGHPGGPHPGHRVHGLGRVRRPRRRPARPGHPHGRPRRLPARAVHPAPRRHRHRRHGQPDRRGASAPSSSCTCRAGRPPSRTGSDLSKQIGANLSLALFGAVLIVVMLVFPGGHRRVGAADLGGCAWGAAWGPTQSALASRRRPTYRGG